jgi:hypothetical protein
MQVERLFLSEGLFTNSQEASIYSSPRIAY